MNRLFIDQKLLKAIIEGTEGPCLSLELPTKSDPVDRKHNALLLRETVKEAIAMLEESSLESNVKEELTDQLASVYNKMEFKYFWHGLGIYVAQNIAEFVYFPFPVSKVVKIGSGFTIRNILHLKQYVEPYKVLLLTKNKVRLFSAIGNIMEEVKDERFPMVYTEDYEYSRSTLGNSYGYMMKNFEKDKTSAQKKRIHSFLHHADDLLQQQGEEQNIVVAGTEKMLGEFEVSSNWASVIGEVTGSFKDSNLHQLVNKAWYCMKDYKETRVKRLVETLDEQKERELIVSGADDVLNVAKEGRGQVLIVERELSDQSKELSDLIDNAILNVLKKDGEVLFTEKDELSEYGHIVMKLRY